jgi:hypothetical protein
MRVVDLNALDRAQHGNGRCDAAIAIEQGCADKTNHHHDRTPPALFGAPRADQGEERENATLTMVVRTHDQDRVFYGDDDDQRPKDEREDSQHSLR